LGFPGGWANRRSPLRFAAVETTKLWHPRLSLPKGLNRLRKNSAQVPKGRLKIRAVQISWLVDSVGLILWDKRVLPTDLAKWGWG